MATRVDGDYAEADAVADDLREQLAAVAEEKERWKREAKTQEKRAEDWIGDAKEAQAENARLRSENLCDACAGTPISGKPCMCGGSAKMSDAAVYLRAKFIEADEENDRLLGAIAPTAENLGLYERAMRAADDDAMAELRAVLAAIAARAGVKL
jgi:hypothetical protein